MPGNADSPWQDANILHDLYWGESLTTYEIADRLGCSQSTVSNWMDQHEVQNRRSDYEDGPWRDRERLRRLYWEKSLSIHEVGDRLDCSGETIRRWLRIHDLGVREHSNPDAPWQNRRTLRELYVEKSFSTSDIADRFDCSRTTVSHWLDRHGIETRTTDYSDAPWHDPNLLYELYWEDYLSIEEIADQLGCGSTTARRWMKKFDIDTREPRREKIEDGDGHRDAQTLEHLYWNEGLSTTEVANKLDVSKTAVLRWMDIHDIPTRDRNQRSHPYQQEEKLRQLHVDECLSNREIGEKFDVDRRTISRWLRRFEIETPEEFYLKNGEPWKAKDHMRRLYLEEDYGVADLAEEMDCAIRNIHYWLKKHDIPRRDPHIPINYDPDAAPTIDAIWWNTAEWTEAREDALARDTYECQQCGMVRDTHYEQYGMDLHVHHITPRREFYSPVDETLDPAAHNLSNLITLCISCHRNEEARN